VIKYKIKNLRLHIVDKNSTYSLPLKVQGLKQNQHCKLLSNYYDKRKRFNFYRAHTWHLSCHNLFERTRDD